MLENPAVCFTTHMIARHQFQPNPTTMEHQVGTRKEKHNELKMVSYPPREKSHFLRSKSGHSWHPGAAVFTSQNVTRKNDGSYVTLSIHSIELRIHVDDVFRCIQMYAVVWVPWIVWKHMTLIQYCIRTDTSCLTTKFQQLRAQPLKIFEVEERRGMVWVTRFALGLKRRLLKSIDFRLFCLERCRLEFFFNVILFWSENK